MPSTPSNQPNRKRHWMTLNRDERGLTTVEYVIILVLIAVGSIGTWRAFGSSLGAKIDDSGRRIRDMDGISLDGKATETAVATNNSSSGPSTAQNVNKKGASVKKGE